MLTLSNGNVIILASNKTVCGSVVERGDTASGAHVPLPASGGPSLEVYVQDLRINAQIRLCPRGKDRRPSLLPSCGLSRPFCLSIHLGRHMCQLCTRHLTFSWKSMRRLLPVLALEGPASSFNRKVPLYAGQSLTGKHPWIRSSRASGVSSLSRLLGPPAFSTFHLRYDTLRPSRKYV
jgi:hypothetical protein